MSSVFSLDTKSLYCRVASPANGQMGLPQLSSCRCRADSGSGLWVRAAKQHTTQHRGALGALAISHDKPEAVGGWNVQITMYKLWSLDARRCETPILTIRDERPDLAGSTRVKGRKHRFSPQRGRERAYARSGSSPFLTIANQVFVREGMVIKRDHETPERQLRVKR